MMHPPTLFMGMNIHLTDMVTVHFILYQAYLPYMDGTLRASYIPVGCN